MATAIHIEDVWKQYRLGVIGHGTLTQDLQSYWARIRGKEDPNSKIGAFAGQEKQIQGDRFWALSGIDLEVKQGEILGIIGKNGAGKSTLLKILSRVTAPTQGRIKVRGRIASLLEVGTGFHPELTGRENIFLNGAILGMSKPEIRAKLDEIVDFSGVADFIDTPVKRYSSGMYVRLAFAVAAHLEPEILVVDEVLAVGDAEFQKKALGKMKHVSHNEGRTVLFVSHNMNSISSLCKTGIVLESGSISIKDTAQSAINKYLVRSTVTKGVVDFQKDESNNLERVGNRMYAEFISLRTEDDQGHIREIFSIGAPFIVCLSIQIKRKVYNPEIGVCISSSSGTRLQHLVSNWNRDLGSINEGVLDLKLTLDELKLYPGKYSLTVWIRYPNPGPPDDFIESALQFEVYKPAEVLKHINFGPYSPNGGVYQAAKWDFV